MKLYYANYSIFILLKYYIFYNFIIKKDVCVNIGKLGNSSAIGKLCNEFKWKYVE